MPSDFSAGSESGPEFPTPEADPHPLPSLSDGVVHDLLETSWDACAVLDPNGWALYASPSNRRVFGYEADALVGLNGFDLVHPDDHPALKRVLADIRNDPDRPITFAHRFRAADGSWRAVETRLQNRLAHPAIQGLVVHSRDTTIRERLRDQLRQARADLRRLQLHPHFVLNALNAVHSQLPSEPDAAAETLVHLADLLRLSYAHVDAPLVSLGTEVAFLERYVDLYRLRFPGCLRATFAVPDTVRSVLVPSLLLQPLVENALRHGVLPAGGGELVVRARHIGTLLHLDVLDTGAGMASEPAEEVGIGLRATRERLRHTYGPEASLSVRPRPEGGTAATVRLPFHGPNRS